MKIVNEKLRWSWDILGLEGFMVSQGWDFELYDII